MKDQHRSQCVKDQHRSKGVKDQYWSKGVKVPAYRSKGCEGPASREDLPPSLLSFNSLRCVSRVNEAPYRVTSRDELYITILACFSTSLVSVYGIPVLNLSK